MLTKLCLHCGKTINKPITEKMEDWLNRHKFCSQKCHYAHGRTDEVKAKISASLIGHKNSPKGELSPHWKQHKDLKYVAIHHRIRYLYGEPTCCENCSGDSKHYEWANLDHRYSLDRNDWMMLCVSCHRKYDRNMAFILKGILNMVLVCN